MEYGWNDEVKVPIWRKVLGFRDKVARCIEVYKEERERLKCVYII